VGGLHTADTLFGQLPGQPVHQKEKS